MDKNAIWVVCADIVGANVALSKPNNKLLKDTWSVTLFCWTINKSLPIFVSVCGKFNIPRLDILF